MKSRARLLFLFVLFPWQVALSAGEEPVHASPREISIGVLVSLDGPGAESDGRIYRALEGYLSGLPPSSSLRFRLRLIPAEKQWGRQTEEIVRSIFEDRTTVIVGGTDARSAHLAAQIISRSKGAALLISLASDITLTQSGVPWVFRVAPSSADGAVPEEGALAAVGAVVRAYREGASSVEEIRDFLAVLPRFLTARAVAEGTGH